MARNIIFEDNDLLLVTVTHPTSPVSGGPVRWGAGTVGKAGVAETTEDTVTGKTTVRFRGVATLSVKGIDGSGNSTVAEGDALYYVDADTPNVSKKATGVLIGHAMEGVTSAATATIRVRLAG